MKKKLISAVLCAAMAASLTACGGSSSTESASASAASSSASSEAEAEAETEAAGGSVITVMLSTNVMSLDTNLATDGDSFEVIADCIEGLTQMDADGAAIPAIAESWDISDDGMTYTFHLREDAVWSNGTPVTANDFVFAWQKAMTDNIEYNYMFCTGVGNVVNGDECTAGEKDPSELGVTAEDDYTLVVSLTAPVSFFPSLMCFPTFFPINQEFYEGLDAGTYGTSPETYLSNGPFVLTDYTPGTASLSLEKNPNFFDADSVSLAGIKYQVVGSSDNALTAFKSGELDVVMISGDQVASVEEDEELSKYMEVTGAGYMWYLTFSQTENNANGDLANQNLRLAISNAIDRELLVDNYVMDGSTASYTAVPADFAPSATTGEDFSGDQDKFKDVCSFDPEKAQAYFKDACEELGKDSFEFTIIYGNNEGDEVAKVAQALKEQIEEVLPDITINLSNMTKNERLDKMQNDNYEIALTRWGPDFADPMTYLGMWITNNANNYGFWSNADYDQLITDCSTGAYVSDYEARWQAMYDAETIVMNEAVIAPLYTKANANLIATGVEGIEFHPMAVNRVYTRATKG